LGSLDSVNSEREMGLGGAAGLTAGVCWGWEWRRSRAETTASLVVRLADSLGATGKHVLCKFTTMSLVMESSCARVRKPAAASARVGGVMRGFAALWAAMLAQVFFPFLPATCQPTSAAVGGGRGWRRLHLDWGRRAIAQ